MMKPKVEKYKGLGYISIWKNQTALYFTLYVCIFKVLWQSWTKATENGLFLNF